MVPAADARRLLLAAQGLLADPARRATPAAVRRQIEKMGFVQVDTIQVVERAHHHILMSRFDDYRPAVLARLLERDRSLFEQWAHDAAVVPTRFFPYWWERFERDSARLLPYWRKRFGKKAQQTIDGVLSRIEHEGPLRARDIDDPKRARKGTFWNWKPGKAALEWLWRSGQLAITRRDGFEKVYDLPERVHPEAVATPRPDPEEQIAWVCRTALERLGPSTPKQVQHFLGHCTLAEAKAWLAAAVERGEVVPVSVENVDGSVTEGLYTLAGWRRRAARAPEAPDRMRLLSPFEPAFHDRARTERWFGFSYRLECFIPAAKRDYGYFVMPILDGERLVGRLDPKLDRERGVLNVLGLWWEPGVRETRARKRRLEDALGRLAEQMGARDFSLR